MIYFISNLGDKFSQGQIRLATESKQVEIFDPLTGKQGMLNSKIENEKTVINLHLEPGQSCVLKCRNSELSEQKWSDYAIKK